MRALDRLKSKVKPIVGTFIPRYREISFKDIIAQLAKWNNDQHAPSYSVGHYQGLISNLRPFNATNPNAVLELGPGAHLGTLYCFLAAGASRAVGLDIAPAERDPAFFERLHRYLQVVSGFRWWRPLDARHGYEYPTSSWDDLQVSDLMGRLEYKAPFTADSMPFEEAAFDLVYSGAAMEHFDNPKGAVEEIYRVLKPGGITIHGIDLRSHAPDGDLAHYKMSAVEYAHVTQKYDESHGISDIIAGGWRGQPYCNRTLLSDWKRYFEETGFDVLEAAPVLRVPPQSINPLDFSPPYHERTAEELAPLVVTIIARKPS